MTESKPSPLDAAVFAVHRKPYCVWDWQLKAHNLEFLRGIDHRYFSYTAGVHAKELHGEHKQRAATAIRTTYHHGLETLFTLLGAGMQAPHCVPGWILKCSTGELRNLVERVQNELPTPNLLEIDAMSWEAIASKLIMGPPEDPGELAKLRDLFGGLWAGFAREFLKRGNQLEYNSLKHGFRMKPGGFTMRIGNPSPSGGPPTADQMHLLGGSEFGTSFLSPEPMEGGPPLKDDDTHFGLAVNRVIWNPASLIHGLTLISLSIHSVVSGLRVLNHDPKEDIYFGAPDDLAAFDLPFRDYPGIDDLQQKISVHEGSIQRFSVDELREMLRQHGVDLG